jgi:hypothetical protein
MPETTLFTMVISGIQGFLMAYIPYLFCIGILLKPGNHSILISLRCSAPSYLPGVLPQKVAPISCLSAYIIPSLAVGFRSGKAEPAQPASFLNEVPDHTNSFLIFFF